MEKLKKDGKIKRWGISNFDTADMEELWTPPDGKNAQSIKSSITLEHEALSMIVPWQKRKQLPIMAYSPIAHGGRERERSA